MSKQQTILKSAQFSDCGLYRFTLERKWDPALENCCWIMLNPSTADADADDPTVRKCVGFSKRWGFGSIVVVNLYAYRATDPRVLKLLPITNGISEAIGMGNNRHIVEQITSAGRIVCAWGNNATVHRANTVLQMDCLVGKYVWHLGLTKSGKPRHPLMLSYETHLTAVTGSSLVL
jgi:hypothetical protein